MALEPFRFTENSDVSLLSLTPLQRAQLRSALSYHSLRSPGEELEFRVFVGGLSETPVLGDPEAVGGGEASLPAWANGAPALTVRVRSTAVGRGEDVDHGTVRLVRVTHPEATPATVAPSGPMSAKRRVYRALERRSVIALDAVREFVMRRRERELAQPLEPYRAEPEQCPVAAAYAELPDAAAPPETAVPAVLFGLHWFQTGGAERWAIQSIQIAKDQGLLPVVVTDQDSVQGWMTRPELEGCVILSLSGHASGHRFDAGLTRSLLENYAFRGVVVHHCSWLYRSLPWIKEQRPSLPVVDSLHIVEYLGGGYPGYAVRFDGLIDQHHVISPELVRWLTEVQRVDPAKVAMAPLTSLTVDESQQFRPRQPGAPFVISFVGRLSRQKRPDLFLALVNRLRRAGIPVRALLHGDGELRETVALILKRYNLEDVIEQRFEDTPVAETLAETDVLVITSINEGITLTTFEAVAAGVPVLSTDVGSQRTIVRGELLLPRPARAFLRLAKQRVRELMNDEHRRRAVWGEQQARVAEFAQHQDAHEWMKELFEQWSR